MDIERKLESHTVCICRHAFWTDFACKINFKSNFRKSVGFQKNCLNFIIFQKCKICSMYSGRTFPVSNFLKSGTERHCSNDTKEADILDRCELPLKGVKSTAINGKIVRYSLKSFEQCICSFSWLNDMSLVVRKPVFGVSDQVRHKPGCAVTEGG